MSEPNPTASNHTLSYPRFLWRALGVATDGNVAFYTRMVALTAVWLVGVNAFAHQTADGLGRTAMTDHVSWGMYIGNFTFGVGLELRSTASGDMDLDAHGAMERLRSGASAFVFPTVEEQAGHIVACLDAIARHAPALPVVITLSPVPLSGYFGELNVATANTLSKANLRQAIAMARVARPFIYAPIYEIVSSIAPCVMNTSVWGDGKTSRHPSPALVKDICSAFVDMLGRTDATPT